MNMFTLRPSALHFLKEPGAAALLGQTPHRTRLSGHRGPLTGPPLYHCGLFTTDVIVALVVCCCFFLQRASPEITASLSCLVGLEGRAGMAAITPREGRRFDSVAFYQHVAKFLPNYARPRFVRVQVSSTTLPLLVRHRDLAVTPHPLPSSLLVVAGLPGRHGNVQVPEDSAGEGGLRPQPGGAPTLFPGRTAAGLRTADAGNLRFRRVGEDQNLEGASATARDPTRHFSCRILHSEHAHFKMNFNYFFRPQL